MAIAFVQSWNYDDGNNTPSHSYTISGATAGNRLFAALVGRVHRTVSTPPTGWYEEEIRSTAVDDPSPIIVYSRVATGDSNDNFSITMSGNITLAFVAAEYSGVDSTAAAIAEATDVTRELIDNTTNTSVTTGTVTPSTADGMFLLVGAVEVQSVYSGASETVSGYTFRVYEDQSSASTSYPGIWLFDHIISGSSGETATFTSSTPTGTTSSGTILIYVPPAAGGGVSLTAESGSFTHTGIAAGLLLGRKVSGDAQSYALTGQDAGLLKGFSALIEAGDFTVSGGATGLRADRLVTAYAASYTVTGIDAGLTYTPVGSYSLTTDVGSFTLTGIDAGTLFGRAVFADAQSYALTGNDATLTYTPSGAYDLTADVGAFLLTGNDAALTYAPAGSFSITADVGTFSLAGQATNLLADRTISAAAESFALTGLDAGLAQGRGLSADAGSFALTGIDAGFGRTYQVAADLGNFTLTGVAATLRYSEAVTMSGRVQLERGTLRSIRSTRTLRT